MSIELPPLPYPADALSPYVSAETLEFHHGKHHKAYVDKLNAAIVGTTYENQTLETIVANSHQSNDAGVFNNAAQAWNHTFLWNSMSPNGGGNPEGALAEEINDRFGSIENFRTAFRESALAQFGSGWTWFVQSDDGLDIVNTANAGTPLLHGLTPLLTLDVWEHAYYLDYQNRRDAYIDAFLSELINWDFASSNLAAEQVAA